MTAIDGFCIWSSAIDQRSSTTSSNLAGSITYFLEILGWEYHISAAYPSEEAAYRVRLSELQDF